MCPMARCPRGRSIRVFELSTKGKVKIELWVPVLDWKLLTMPRRVHAVRTSCMNVMKFTCHFLLNLRLQDNFIGKMQQSRK